MAEAVCPLCRCAAFTVLSNNLSWRYTCRTCGTFELWDFALQTFGSQERWNQARVLLSNAARKASDEGHPLELRDEGRLLEAIAATRVEALS